MADAFTNFAKSTLVGGLAPATTTLTVQAGDGVLFPAAGAGQTFRCVIQNAANQREVIQVTLRTGDVFNTIVRAQEGTAALTWNAGDRIGHRLTAAQLNNILVSSDLQQNTKTWCGTAGGTANALTLTPTPAVTAMVAGHKFIFKTGAAANTTVVTFSVSGLATFAGQNSGVALVAGALTPNTWWEVLYDGAAGQLKKYTIGVETAIYTAKGSLPSASAANTPAERTVGSNGQALTADSSQTSGLVYVDSPSRPILNTNPNWLFDQVNEGALYTVNATDVRGPDGWSGDAVGTGVFKLRTLADPDNAAFKCLEITCTTADLAIAATDRYEIWTAVEGYDAAALQLGVASAQSFTYQFGLKSNAVTGVFGVYFSNSAGDRFYAGTITVPDTAAHEYSVSLTGDLTGTWLYTGGIGLRMGLVLAAGANFQGTAGVWGASTVRTAATQVNFMSVNTNVLYLKRGQLIPGALVQAYRPADVQKELAKCERYFEKSYSMGVVPGTATNAGITYIGSNGNPSGVFQGLGVKWNTRKRAAPTLLYWDSAGNASKMSGRANGGWNDNEAGFSFIITSEVGFWADPTDTQARSTLIQYTANARLS